MDRPNPHPCDTLNEGPEIKSARKALETVVADITNLSCRLPPPEPARQMGDLAQAGNFLLAYLAK